MSAIALALAMERVINDAHAKHVLIHLANRHHPDTGLAVPSVERLAAESEISVATVRRKLELLEQNGHIEIQHRAGPDGRRLVNAYILRFVPDPADIPSSPHAKRRGLPPRDWTPSERCFEEMKKDFQANEEDVTRLARDWVDFCYANGRSYVRFDDAFLNNARARVARIGLAAATGRKKADAEHGSHGALGAVRDLLRHSNGNLS